MLEVLVAVIGICAGITTGVFGLGGAIVILPALTFLGFNLREAIGISFFQMFFVIGISLYLRHRSYRIDFAMVRFTLPFIIIGAIVGIIVSHMIPVKFLQLAFGVVLIYLALNMVLPKKDKVEKHFAALNKPAVALLAVVTGLYSGFFGVGGTSIFTPGLTALGYEISKAISVSLFSVFGIAGVGVVGYSYVWIHKLHLAIILCAGAIAGLLVGHRISLADKTKKLTLYGLAFLIALSGLIMLVKSFYI